MNLKNKLLSVQKFLIYTQTGTKYLVSSLIIIAIIAFISWHSIGTVIHCHHACRGLLNGAITTKSMAQSAQTKFYTLVETAGRAIIYANIGERDLHVEIAQKFNLDAIKLCDYLDEVIAALVADPHVNRAIIADFAAQTANAKSTLQNEYVPLMRKLFQAAASPELTSHYREDLQMSAEIPLRIGADIDAVFHGIERAGNDVYAAYVEQLLALIRNLKTALISAVIGAVVLVIIFARLIEKAGRIKDARILEQHFTLEKQYAELLELKEAAEAGSQAMSDFLANMSHEIRTPLNAITGMTTIAQQTETVERKNFCLGKISEAALHLLGIINDVLDMSKIQANKLELSLVEFDFEKMLQRVANLMSFRFHQRHQDFSIAMPQHLDNFVIGDDQRLAQIIINLLGNAVKFSPENGKIACVVEVVEQSADACSLQISVADNGIGISPEEQLKIFNSYEQSNSGISRQYGGTGLGLALSKHFIEMMGGKIWIDSAVGKGSTFTFVVPLKLSAKLRGVPEFSDDRWSRLRLLMVDDDDLARDYFRQIMENFHIACDVAASGSEALALIEKHRYDFYFIDWRMPEMDGLELIRRLRKEHSEQAVTIMISSAEWNDIEPEARGVGVRHFLPKPLFPSTIFDVLNECLGIDVRRSAEIAKSTALFPGRCVLLADDIEINRVIVQTLLAPTQLEIVCAEDGVQAVAIFRDNPEKYALIFMDMQMPEMDGYTATRKIRALPFPWAQKVPIIAMTADVFKADIDKCFAAGMTDHVGKPLDFTVVIEKLKKYIAP